MTSGARSSATTNGLPRVRIASDGLHAARVELVTKAGTVIDLSNVVASVTWRFDAGARVAAAELVVFAEIDAEAEDVVVKQADS